jgi:hypothetical protein
LELPDERAEILRALAMKRMLAEHATRVNVG